MTVNSTSRTTGNPELVKKIAELAHAEGIFSKKEISRLSDGYVSSYDLKEAKQTYAELAEKAASLPEQYARKQKVAELIVASLEVAYCNQANSRRVSEAIKDFFGRLINGK